MTHSRSLATRPTRRPAEAARFRVVGGAAAVMLAVGITGCGSSDAQGGGANPSPSPTKTPSTSPSTEPADTSVLSGDTDPGSVAVFAKRELCVNGSDYYYVLTNFSADPTATEQPDAAFVKAAIGRAKNLANTLSQQVPAAQASNAEGASKTWQVIEREARQRGYETNDLTGFFNDLAAQVKQYTPGNAALTRYLANTCSTKVPEFGTALAPPT